MPLLILCVLVAGVVAHFVAAGVGRSVAANGSQYATAIQVVTFIGTFLAVLFLGGFILASAFRFGR
jgi:hypothetical protein